MRNKEILAQIKALIVRWNDELGEKPLDHYICEQAILDLREVYLACGGKMDSDVSYIGHPIVHINGPDGPEGKMRVAFATEDTIQTWLKNKAITGDQADKLRSIDSTKKKNHFERLTDD